MDDDDVAGLGRLAVADFHFHVLETGLGGNDFLLFLVVALSVRIIRPAAAKIRNAIALALMVFPFNE